MGEPDGEAEFSPLGAAGNQVPRQQHFGAGRIRVRFQRGPVDVAECGCRDGFEADAAPDPRRYEPRRDVPAVHVRRFAHPQRLPVSRKGVLRRRRREPPSLRDRRSDRHFQAVLPGDGQSGHVEGVRDQHIGGPPRLDAVQPDGRKTVDPVEDQPEPFRRKCIEAENGLIQPFALLEFKRPVDVVAAREVGEDARTHQVEFDVAGDFGGDFAPFIAGLAVLQAPGAVEVPCIHFVLLRDCENMICIIL